MYTQYTISGTHGFESKWGLQRALISALSIRVVGQPELMALSNSGSPIGFWEPSLGPTPFENRQPMADPISHQHGSTNQK